MKDKQTILVVDDEASNIDVIYGILKEFDVVTTLDGKTAIDIVQEEDIDLILLDVMMPNMDGFEVCRILKENEKVAKIPIIFLTSKNELKDIQKGFEVGAVDYITKPFNAIELIIRINTHLKLRGYEKNLEKEVSYEIQKNRLGEQIMVQQSKQAEMGELLMHIAHQWKQPLSELGSINTYNIAMTKQEDIFKDKVIGNELSSSFEKSSKILKFMSDTVYTFQNFYKPDTSKEFFNISESVNNAINLIDATYDYENIVLNIKKEQSPIIYGNKNEYSQVILSILNNAKDIFKLRKIEKPFVELVIKEKNGKSVVTIIDNGGGINMEDKNKIFLPFVSEKNSVGIGLYMARTILEKNNGTISAQNKNDGLEFTIIL